MVIDYEPCYILYNILDSGQSQGKPHGHHFLYNIKIVEFFRFHFSPALQFTDG